MERTTRSIAAGVIFLLFGSAVAAQPLGVPLPAPFPAVELRTILIAIHLAGLFCGLGATTMLDFWVMRWLRWGGMPPVLERTFQFLMKVATAGLILLWVSGLGFLALYSIESPAKLDNPKLWAKITIVIALTINGAFLHAYVLPGVLREVTRPILHGLSRTRAGLFLVTGAVSGVSWYSAFALGILREFNGTVPFGLLIVGWALAVVLASAAVTLLWHVTRRSRERPAGRVSTIAVMPAVPAGETVEPDTRRVPPDAFVALSREPTRAEPPWRLAA